MDPETTRHSEKRAPDQRRELPPGRAAIHPAYARRRAAMRAAVRAAVHPATPTGPTVALPVTRSDIPAPARLHPRRIAARSQPARPTVVIATALAAATLAGAAACTTGYTPPEPRVCGTIADQPIRVADAACAAAARTGDLVAGPAGVVRWWAADPDCLDADDRTPVGGPVDDDYLGEPCDDPAAARTTTRRPASRPATTATTPAPTTTARPTATPPPTTTRPTRTTTTTRSTP